MKTIAVVCSDLHLCHTAPSCRAEKEKADWYEVMGRHLGELVVLSGSLMEGPVPILISGDIFDRWQNTNELINFTIDHLRPAAGEVYAIPGQHDLPNHRYDEMYRTGYGNLAKAGVIFDLREKMYFPEIELMVHPFPWGRKIIPTESDPTSDLIKVALIHAYAWKEGYSHPGASDTANVKKHLQNLEGYDTAIFGDNHHGFDCPGTPYIFNCGCFIRRSRTEIGLKPRVGLLKEDGTVETHYLECAEQDEFVDDPIEVWKDTVNIFDVDDLDMDSIDFRQVLDRKVQASDLNKAAVSEVSSIMTEAGGDDG